MSKLQNDKSEIKDPKSAIEDPQSDALILEERARVLAKARAKEADKDEIMRLVTFKVGEERYGVDTALLLEIKPLKANEWSLVPGTPDFIVGAVNIRGRIYSVMDIAHYLGLPLRPISETTHVILVKGGKREGEDEMELCILADDVPQVTSIPVAKVQPSPDTGSGSTQKYVRGVMDDLLAILDLDRLLADPGIVVNEEA
mgnify:CR=1 FL=1